MANEIIKDKNSKLIPRRNEMKEGIHFYMESGYMVFTESYHMQRGYCCKSGCRHCPYGFKKK
jgi:hypothetical protein